MKKYRFFILLLVVLIFLMCSCGGQKKDAVRKEKINIGVTVYDSHDTFISSMVSYIEMAAKIKETTERNTIKINVMGANGSQATQNDHVDYFISQEYDVICINIVERALAANLIEKAKKANIPVIFFNREPVEEDMDIWGKTYYVGAPAAESGILQGNMVANLYKEKPLSIDKNKDSILQYVIFEGEPGHQDSLIRTETSIKTVEQSGIEVEKLANAIANWDRAQAASKMRQWIDLYGNQIEVVFSNNDDMALGAIDAYEAAQIPQSDWPLIVGIDATKPAIEAIKEGKMYGSAHNNAKGQAEAVFDMAYSLTKDGTIPSHINLVRETYVRLPYKSVTKENIEEFIVD